MNTRTLTLILFALTFLLACFASASAQPSPNSRTIVGNVTGFMESGVGPRTARHLGERPSSDYKVAVVVEADGAKYTCFFSPIHSTRIIGRKIEEREDLRFLYHKLVRATIRNGPVNPEAGGNYNAELVRLTTSRVKAR